MIHATMNNLIEKNWQVPADPNPTRLDAFVASLCPEFSRAQIQQWIKSGALTLNGNIIKPSLKLLGGENIQLQATLKPKIQDEPENIPLTLIYEDDDFLIINKPIGLVVHPGAGQSKHTLLNALLHHCPSLEYLPRAGILHRLDKNTSGLLLVAKNAESYQDLRKQLQARTLSREYQAIATGKFISGGSIDAPIGRHPIHRKRMSVNDSGKHALTHFRILDRFENFTHVKVKLETGRTHQIRVHFSHIKHPIVGDATYGFRLCASKNMHPDLLNGLRQFKHQALHASTLGLTHPKTGQWMEFHSDAPEDFQRLLELLHLDLNHRAFQ